MIHTVSTSNAARQGYGEHAANQLRADRFRDTENVSTTAITNATGNVSTVAGFARGGGKAKGRRAKRC